MVTLTRPEGSEPSDLNLSRRLFAGVFFAGYAVSAVSASAEPITTDETGLATGVVELAAADRAVPAYVARPTASGRHPVVLVASEIFGVHEYIRDVCRRLAKEGYVAIAPDFFVRHGDPAAEKDFPVIRRIVEQASEAQVMGDLRAAIAWASAQPFADVGRLGITGFCWGGAVVWRAAEVIPEIDAGVAWYGRLARPKDGEFLSGPAWKFPLERAPALRAPVLGLYGGKDQGISLESVQQMKWMLEGTRKLGSDIFVYPDAGHGFHADYRPSYDAQAATDGWKRMIAHFKAAGL
jgi:carboxymethylenebutenolidase